MQKEPMSPREAQPCRPLPVWAWALAAVLFPPGVFVAMAVAHALKWRGALFLAVLSYGLMMLYVTGLALVSDRSLLPHNYLLLGLWLSHGCAGLTQYAIGCRAGLWTARGLWVWRLVGAFYVVVLVVLAGYQTFLVVLASIGRVVY